MFGGAYFKISVLTSSDMLSKFQEVVGKQEKRLPVIMVSPEKTVLPLSSNPSLLSSLIRNFFKILLEENHI